MSIMHGKRGIVFGVSNKRGIAHAIAEKLFQNGAEIAFTYANEAMESRVRPIAEEMDAKIIMECDVTKEEDVQKVFDAYEKLYGNLDFVLHAVAFANREDLQGNFSDTSKAGWDTALGVSSYSLISMARCAKKLMNDGGSICALSYIGSEKAVANYNIMGVAKAALEASVRYLAQEFGEQDIRVNALSAGPIKTLAAKGIGGFDHMLKLNEIKAPLGRNTSLDDVANSALYLLSDLSSGVTGETLHVDCGVHAVGASKNELLILNLAKAK
ncbi:MAG: enoyl-ACP reductase [Candidatus Gastranaerophilales bacterium]|nr:enoyl-ACP reductase [Candidatus Gastranaerophilales bacterium]